MAKYRQTITIDKKQTWAIKKALAWKEGDREDLRLTEDEDIIKTVVFEDGVEMDIKCCGADEGGAWTEAILFKKGWELAFTEPSEDFFGEWMLEYEGNSYIVDVVEET